MLIHKKMLFNNCIVFQCMNYCNLFNRSQPTGHLGCVQSVAMNDLRYKSFHMCVHICKNDSFLILF